MRHPPLHPEVYRAVYTIREGLRWIEELKFQLTDRAYIRMFVSSCSSPFRSDPHLREWKLNAAKQSVRRESSSSVLGRRRIITNCHFEPIRAQGTGMIYLIMSCRINLHVKIRKPSAGLPKSSRALTASESPCDQAFQGVFHLSSFWQSEQCNSRQCPRGGVDSHPLC